MGSFFALLLMFLFVYWIVIPLLRFRFRVRRGRRQFNDIFSAFGGGQDGQTAGSRPGGWDKTPPARKKKFTREEGEYIEFEEVDTASCSYNPGTGQTETQFTSEQQITDVEWEDLPPEK